MNGLFKDTLTELFDRKTPYLFLVMTIIAMVIVMISGSVEINMQSMGTDESVELKELGFDLNQTLLQLLHFIMYIFLFLSVMMTAGIVPGMFIKGRADYYLAKPLSRNSLLIKKFVSVWIVYGFQYIICGLIVYFTGALVHSVFDANIFLLMLLSFSAFFVWLTFSFFFGINSQSTVKTIVYLSLIWLTQFVLSMVHSGKESLLGLINAKIVVEILDVIYYIFPKTGDFHDTAENIVIGQPVTTYVALYSTIAFAVITLIATLFVFKKKNY